MTTLPVEVQCAHRAPLRAESARRLTVVLALSVGVMLVEAVGGYLAHSLALLADAGHMLADAAAIGMSVGVAYLAQRPATPERSFGLVRLEILAALVNGAFLIVIALGIGLEAYRRLRTPPEVHAGLMLTVAALGLAVNVASAALLHAGHEHSLNQRGAYLHVLSDALGALGALVAAGIILVTGRTIADPAISVLIALLILRGAWRLTRESVEILLESTPAHISLPDVHGRIASLPGVTSVHDLHVWTVRRCRDAWRTWGSGT
ncbi:MAG: cation transporter [Gemmatimonadetes bacterium]|nr:MAG: cation transporter [Gemmatimonadota bacterium]